MHAPVGQSSLAPVLLEFPGRSGFCAIGFACISRSAGALWVKFCLHVHVGQGTLGAVLLTFFNQSGLSAVSFA